MCDACTVRSQTPNSGVSSSAYDGHRELGCHFRPCPAELQGKERAEQEHGSPQGNKQTRGNLFKSLPRDKIIFHLGQNLSAQLLLQKSQQSKVTVALKTPETEAASVSGVVRDEEQCVDMNRR